MRNDRTWDHLHRNLIAQFASMPEFFPLRCKESDKSTWRVSLIHSQLDILPSACLAYPFLTETQCLRPTEPSHSCLLVGDYQKAESPTCILLAARPNLFFFLSTRYSRRSWEKRGWGKLRNDWFEKKIGRNPALTLGFRTYVSSTVSPPHWYLDTSYH